MKVKQFMAVLVFAFTASSCMEEPAPEHSIYFLMDTSGTYTKELEKAQHVINYTLSQLQPGDSFAVARVDTGSFSEKDIIAKTTLNERPSTANQQKLAFRDEVSNFVKRVIPSPHTDITGGILQATDYLNESGARKKIILVFSDLKEDLQEGYIRNIPLKLDNIEVVALNVTKLRSDNIDPREYMNRLTDWQQKVTSGSGNWRVINDLERLEKILIGS